MRRLAARLFASAYRRFRSALARLVGRGRRRPDDPVGLRAKLFLAPMESRDHTGNLAGGLALAAFGQPLADPLQAMAIAVGDFALLSAPAVAPVSPVQAGDAPRPVTHWLAQAPLALPAEAPERPSDPAFRLRGSDVQGRPDDPRDDFWTPLSSPTWIFSFPTPDPSPPPGLARSG